MKALVIGELEILEEERDTVVSRLLSDGWEVVAAGLHPPLASAEAPHDRLRWHLMDLSDTRYIYGLRNALGDERAGIVVYCGYKEDLETVKMAIHGLYRRFYTADEYLAVYRSTCHRCGEMRSSKDSLPDWHELQQNVHTCRTEDADALRVELLRAETVQCPRGGEEWRESDPRWLNHISESACLYAKREVSRV